MGYAKKLEDIRELSDSIFFCFFALKRYGKRLLEKANFDLTFEQVVILKILKDGEGMNLGELAEVADRDKTTISRMITGLEKRNLVVRVVDKIDTRLRLIYLTHEAKAKLDELEGLRRTMERDAYQGLSAQERKVALDIIKRVAKNVNES